MTSVPRELLQPSTPGQLIRWAAQEWALIAACWAAVAQVPDLRWPLTLVIAGRLHALGVILHDAAHLPVRRTGWRGRLLEVLAGYPIGTSTLAMRYHHLRHHRDTGLPADPYLRPPATVPGKVLAWLRLSLVVPFWFLRGPVGVLAWCRPSLRTFYGRVFLQDRSGEDLSRSAEVEACARADVGQVAAHAVLAIAAVRWPGTLAASYFVPLLLASTFSGYRLLAEHTPGRATSRRAEDVIAVTRDHGLGWFGALFLAPRNVGYHVVHHLHPRASLARLPALKHWYARHPGAVR